MSLCFFGGGTFPHNFRNPRRAPAPTEGRSLDEGIVAQRISDAGLKIEASIRIVASF
ncbi:MULTISPECIES: hypothetical protein [Bradyrhizobium]|uniref:hypothetical protein n=1 Tax=Bradyrhizobium TaxID=374 RepID=UPI000B079BD5|nr:hypothetical protein [Bradyrhizobium japonicum]MCS3534443.1 hypothetical protein [Bradyrhizobium japonicum]MCS3989461.1 hypothetical protein [Bradyrhizobium japonicum]MCS4015723.1 hypothetical protein [Bradyrhizobium japonicum]MCS4202819.1 hypothetical protein [Bradyrhizobium japonicum]MDH6175531.1 hypothetical protein [Bradyrhizobium japonicum]